MEKSKVRIRKHSEFFNNCFQSLIRGYFPKSFQYFQDLSGRETQKWNRTFCFSGPALGSQVECHKFQLSSYSYWEKEGVKVTLWKVSHLKSLTSQASSLLTYCICLVPKWKFRRDRRIWSAFSLAGLLHSSLFMSKTRIENYWEIQILVCAVLRVNAINFHTEIEVTVFLLFR